MRINRSLATALQVVIMLLVTNSCFGVTVKLIDQNGEPVENAVVSVKKLSTTQASAEIESGPLNVVMDQINSQFSPHVLVVEKNQQVIFPNSDNIRHHIYSFSKPNDFEVKMYRGGEQKKLRFDQSGIVVLGCNIHDQMRGYLYVADQEITAITDKQGIVVIDTSEQKLTIWHSSMATNHIDRHTIAVEPDSVEIQTFSLQLLALQQPQKKRKFGSNRLKKSGN